ncbi:M15 family metallopeptidase [Colwellia sp. 4_MG-2023]|uniref:M15 family metallopeptidase n=1 Tax=unclassified Colwellia TaxID=196834 RepID=UPI0026E13CC0|nr:MULTISPECIES: M15 family metallopeptidase [unclassified Colwellia]MDO6507042.1 M15 family metallopeptidase [Colwellia sp. 5_MG-2023]MDO6555912.1 M15 family metallopeptidase [Colwellia sp. 4_MG-2023]
MTAMSPGVTNKKISGQFSAQALGLTDQHIDFFENATSLNTDKPANAKVLGIHKLMQNDYQALVDHAAKAGIEIQLASGFRSFERQLLIWNNKFTGKTAIKDIDGKVININKLSEFEIMNAILLFSALPGGSRHHWGCDIDIYAPNLLGDDKLQLEPWEYDASGPFAKLSSWLVEHAEQYGFYFPYDRFRGGIAEEPWHLSYAPLAKQYQAILSIELLQNLLLETDIAGKDTIIEHLPVIFKRYINNVNTIY